MSGCLLFAAAALTLSCYGLGLLLVRRVRFDTLRACAEGVALGLPAALFIGSVWPLQLVAGLLLLAFVPVRALDWLVIRGVYAVGTLTAVGSLLARDHPITRPLEAVSHVLLSVCGA